VSQKYSSLLANQTSVGGVDTLTCYSSLLANQTSVGGADTLNFVQVTIPLTVLDLSRVTEVFG
jgi:hypothetical protein